MLIDKPGAGALRQQMRPLHKEYLAQKRDRIDFAGPLVANYGSTMVGSLLVIDFDEPAAAHAWLAQEPFVQAGVFASTTVQAFVNLWPQKVGFPS